jgi:hypothetical protein
MMITLNKTGGKEMRQVYKSKPEADKAAVRETAHSALFKYYAEELAGMPGWWHLVFTWK